MSERIERQLQEWHTTKRSRLEYLDLADSEPTLANIYHNQSVTFDRLNLSTVLHTRKLYQLLEKQDDLANQLLVNHKEVHKELKLLRTRLEAHQPLTIAQVKNLVEEIAKQPKLVEEEALKLTAELTKQVHELKDQTHKIQLVLHEVKAYIS